MPEKKTLTIGIDPGVSGAIAILEKESIVDILDVPVVEIQIGKRKKRRISPEILVADLIDYADRVQTAYIEEVHAMPGQGVTSMFAFGEAAGIVRGVMAGLRIRTELVPPTVWKRNLKLTGQGKGNSRALAAQIWPCQADLFRRIKDDGRAEAALLAYWGLRHGI